jgi:hypothetical protein
MMKGRVLALLIISVFVIAGGGSWFRVKQVRSPHCVGTARVNLYSWSGLDGRWFAALPVLDSVSQSKLVALRTRRLGELIVGFDPIIVGVSVNRPLVRADLQEDWTAVSLSASEQRQIRKGRCKGFAIDDLGLRASVPFLIP